MPCQVQENSGAAPPAARVSRPQQRSKRRSSTQLIGRLVASFRSAMRQAASSAGVDGNANIRAEDRGVWSFAGNLCATNCPCG